MHSPDVNLRRSWQRASLAILLPVVLAGCTTAPEPAAPAPTNPEFQYRALAPFPTGVHPNEMALADFDGDGDLDIVTVGLVEPDLTVLRNDGGVFTPVPATPLAAGPIDVEPADLDGDGIPELVAATFEDGRVLVLRATAALDFELVSELSLGGEPAYLDSGDFDGDGNLDMALSRFKGNDVMLLHGDGAGGLAAGPTVMVSSRPGGLCVFDSNGDDQPEVAVVTAGGNELVVLGEVDGAWQIAARADTSDWPTSVVAADIDGDGRPELVGATTLGANLFVADLTGTPANLGLTVREQAAGFGAFDVALSDLDGDGLLDAAVSYKNEDRLALFRGASDGTFTAAADVFTGHGPTPLRSADLDADGLADLVVVNGFSDDLEIFLAAP